MPSITQSVKATNWQVLAIEQALQEGMQNGLLNKDCAGELMRLIRDCSEIHFVSRTQTPDE